jgi:CDP-4-dehydro-6-deoxyglucose reductase, E3
MNIKVRIEPSGHEFHVQHGESVLDAALREGYALPYGCRNGACGSCRGKVLGGRVSYGGELPPALSAEEHASGQALFCRAVPESDLVIEVREVGAAKDIPIKTMPCRVAKLERLAPDVMRLFLKLPATERLQFLAGQYLDVLLKDGRRRGFSMANAPHDDAFIELHIRYMEGGHFTPYVFHDMKEKALLRIEGPLGSFFLREESDRPILLVGGGTGFAPLKSMLEHAFYVGLDRPMHLFWGVRARRDLYLHDLPLAWARDQARFHYTPVLSEPQPEDRWQGETGFVHEALLRAYPDLRTYEVYMAGPPAMIRAAKSDFAKHGLPEEHLYYDSFDFAADAPSSTPALPG